MHGVPTYLRQIVSEVEKGRVTRSHGLWKSSGKRSKRRIAGGVKRRCAGGWRRVVQVMLAVLSGDLLQEIPVGGEIHS